MSRAILEQAFSAAVDFLETLPARPVAPSAEFSFPEADTFPAEPVPDAQVIADLVRDLTPGLMASAGPRYFGFVTGGSLPVAVAADWLTAAWDQNAALHVMSPAAAAVEQAVAGWILQILGLPTSASVGLVTGGQMANFTGLAAARHGVLRRAGWNVEEDGLQGAPPVEIIVNEESHATIFSALRLLGHGTRHAKRVPTDAQGRMRAAALEAALASCHGPTIVCAQAGNVNTGAFDPFEEIAALTRDRQAWLHIDGAFGLWAAASPRLRPLVRGLALADSWATDGHKWLNVPYDSGIVIVADPEAHRAAVGVQAAYLTRAVEAQRDGMDWVPESSRRARAFPLYAGLRALGRRGLAELIERCCSLARRMADRLASSLHATILNDVVLNQVLVRFTPRDGDDADAVTRSVIARVQGEGTCWAGGTTWHGMAAMRISICNWATTEADIDRAAAAILAAVDAVGAANDAAGR